GALDETIGELLTHDNVLTIGAVPVGNSIDGEARIDHPGMRAHTPQEARRAVRQVGRWQRRAREECGRSRVFASDEFYLRAGARIPSAARYDGFPQWENGVGMTRSLLDDWARTRRRIRAGRVGPAKHGRALLVCGTLIAPTLRRLAAEAGALLGVELQVVATPNRLFGGRVNVSGLIPGADFAAAVGAQAPDGDVPVFLPRSSLDYYGRRFLDDMTAEDLEIALRRPLAFVYTVGEVVEWLTAAERSAPAPGRAPRSNGRSWAPEPLSSGAMAAAHG
ncbi:MAG: DUF512 domain-containing protein, partial [Chloroflexota bacterium]|nr:DUF512 domain-containing protein [Chloroflexota bacterium]